VTAHENSYSQEFLSSDYDMYQHIILVALVICIAQNGMARALVLCEGELARRQMGKYTFFDSAYYMCGAMYTAVAKTSGTGVSNGRRIPKGRRTLLGWDRFFRGQGYKVWCREHR
jgi:hypothetical protein